MYSFGPKKPPYCISCAMVAGGVRLSGALPAMQSSPSPGTGRARRRLTAPVTLCAAILVAAVLMAPAGAAPKPGKGQGRPATTTPTALAVTPPTGSTSTTVAPTTSTTAPPTTTTTTASTTTTSVAGAAPASRSGEAMPVGDLPGWNQVFTDDFTTDVPLGSFPQAVSTKWGAYLDGWKDTSGHGRYTPSKVLSVEDGLLRYSIRTEGGVPLVSAPWPKVRGGSTPSANGQLYGRFAVRFRSDALPHYKAAWLLWPDSGVWPRDGEIDFPEGDLDSTIKAFMHRQGATVGSDQDGYYTTATFPTWHTAIIEWKPSSLTFILDGKVLGTSTSRVPNTPMHWVLQTETALGSIWPAASTAGTVEIDWVSVYTMR